jgi:hypothetical protein
MTKSICRVCVNVQITPCSSRFRKAHAASSSACSSWLRRLRLLKKRSVRSASAKSVLRHIAAVSRAALQYRARKICNSASTAGTVSDTGRVAYRRLHISVNYLQTKQKKLDSKATLCSSFQAWLAGFALVYRQMYCDRTSLQSEHLVR